MGSSWVGFENFAFFFQSQILGRVVRNTIVLNLLFITATTTSAVFLAVLFNELRGIWFKKITQSIMLFPTFVSWIIVASIMKGTLGTETGFVNAILEKNGFQTVQFYARADLWPAILTFTRIWKDVGLQMIIYLAAIAAIDPSLYEAATIDGATRLQKISRIILPALLSTVMILTILAIGRIFYADFGMIYGLVGDNGLLLPTTDVVDTFVFRALRKLGNIGMSAAAGFVQSVVGFVFVAIANYTARRFAPEGSLF